MRLLAVSGFVSTVELEERLDGMKVGSGRWPIGSDSGLYAPADKRGVVSRESTTTALVPLSAAE
jgi:hypothetical protein